MAALYATMIIRIRSAADAAMSGRDETANIAEDLCTLLAAEPARYFCGSLVIEIRTRGAELVSAHLFALQVKYNYQYYIAYRLSQTGLMPFC
jgi:hypothetical protein